MKLISPFFTFVNERQRVYLSKQAGESPPWTRDSILQTYRFTNVFREQDATTLWIRDREKGAFSGSNDLRDVMRMIFWTVAARWFNRIETLEVLCSSQYQFGLLEHDRWSRPRVSNVLRDWRPKGPWVTGAYIIHTPNGLGMDKLAGVISDISLVHDDLLSLAEDLCMVDPVTGKGITLEEATKRFTMYRDLGPFMAYEIVSDLRWSVLSDASDILTWANPGPGARRGLGWVYYNDPGVIGSSKGATEQCVSDMRSILAHWRGGRGPKRGNRKAEMRDVEHSLCEFDKYQRVKNGLGRPREKYRYGSHGSN